MESLKESCDARPHGLGYGVETTPNTCGCFGCYTAFTINHLRFLPNPVRQARCTEREGGEKKCLCRAGEREILVISPPTPRSDRDLEMAQMGRKVWW